MPGWLQLLIVYAVVAACVLYSAATLLPRSARIAAATALARLLRRRAAGPGTDRLAALRTALESYTHRHAAAGGCGGCGSCAAQPASTKGTAGPASQPVHWQPRNGR